MSKIHILIFTVFIVSNFAGSDLFLDNLRLILAKEHNKSGCEQRLNDKIIELNIFFDQILKKYVNVKFNDVIEYEDLGDINIFYGNKSEPSNNFLNKINKCKTELGKYILAYKLANPTADINDLTDTQNIIKVLLQNEDIRSKVEKLLVEFSKIEKDIIDFYNEKSDIYCVKNNQRFVKKFYFCGRVNSNKNVKILYFKKIFTDLFDIIIRPYYSGIGIALYLTSYFIMFDNITDNLFLKLSQFVPIPAFKEIVTLINIANIIKALNKKKSLVAGGLFIGGVITSVYSFIKLVRKFKSYKSDFIKIFQRVKNIQNFIKLTNELLKIIKNNDKCGFVIKRIRNIDNLFKNCGIYELDWAVKFLLKTNITSKYLSSNSPSILAIFNILNDNRDVFINILCEFLEIDSYLSICNLIKSDNKNFSFTKFISSRDKPLIILKDLWTPIINSNNIVKNDIELGKNFSNMLLCGHNGGGKSTYLNSIILNLILIQTFGISMSSYSEVTVFDKINLFLNVLDDVNKGDSLYKAEIKKLNKYLNSCKETRNKKKFIFSIFEEPLKGTDSKSAVSILLGVFKFLDKNNKNLINIISSHYNKLTELGNLESFSNFYPYVKISDNKRLIYSYKIKEGINKCSLAIPIAKQIGVDDDIISLCEKEYKNYVE